MAEAIQFLETDTAAIVAANTERLQLAALRDLFPGDPLRLVCLVFSAIQAQAANAANDAANQSFLDQARAEFLDGLGALFGVTRRVPEAARTTLRFSLAEARDEPTLVPIGTRATVQSSGVYWATIEAVEIAIGDTYIDVIAEASVLGPSANNYLTGEIDTLVDPVSFIATVANTSESSDGSDAEDDESLRARIQAAPTRFSIGGPEDAYIAMTQDARADVESVTINSPDPREIDIYFTLEGGAIPAPETIAEVLAYVNDKYRRPMSDVVRVQAPAEVEYTVSFTYYIATADSARAAEVQAAVEAAVVDYIAWQRAAIGRDVNPSELIWQVMDAGALRVVVTAPVYAELDFSELAVIAGEPDLTYGGLDDE
jgi:phage-related baseplate assembly protein